MAEFLGWACGVVMAVDAGQDGSRRLRSSDDGTISSKAMMIVVEVGHVGFESDHQWLDSSRKSKIPGGYENE